MEKLDRDHLPKEIVENDESFYDTTYLLFYGYQLDSQNINEYFQKYHRDFDSLDHIKEKLTSSKKYFDDIEERAIKAMNSSFVRYYIKDLKKKLQFKNISQNFAKRMVVTIIVEIIQEVCYQTYQNLFKERYMDIFEESISHDHLKEEFDLIVMFFIKPLIEGKKKIEPLDYERFRFYKEVYAQCIIEIDNYEMLKELKKRIQDILLLSNQEIEQMANQKQNGQKLEQLEDAKDSFNIINKNNEWEKRERKTKHLLKQIYQQYFMYNEDCFLNYYKSIHIQYELLSKVKDEKDDNILIYLNAYLFQMNNIRISGTNHIKLEMQEEYNVSHIQSVDCIYLLAYYLWHRGNPQQQTKRILGFQNIMNEVNDCYEEFLMLREDPLNDDYLEFTTSVFQFTPQEEYYNDIVLSVVFELDNPIVKRRIKKLILEDYNYQYSLPQMSLKWTQFYEEKEINDNQMNHMCDYADLFIMSYFKNPKSIAIYTPFIRCFRELYNQYHDKMMLFEGAIKDKYFDELVDYYHLHKDQMFLSKYLQLEQVLNLCGKSTYFYNGIVNFEEVLKRYKYRLMSYLCLKDDSFFKQSFDIQIDECLCLCYLFMLIDNINGYRQYMPLKNQIQQDTYIESLLQFIDDKEHLIQIKDQQLEMISQKKHYEKKEQINKDMKLLESEMKYYKQEISSLNKQLLKKNQEIEDLKTHQEELYKLRNLIFTMSQDEEIHDENNLDITSLIRDKNIVVVGGHLHLRDRLKQKYPNLKLLAQFSHINNDALVHADHVFLYYKFMTHEMYNQAMSVIVKNNIPFDYIPYTNLEKSEEVIYKALSYRK